MKILLFSCFFIFCSIFLIAHPMPSSIFNMDIGTKDIQANLEMPLSELQLAMNIDLGENPEHQLNSYQEIIRKYIYEHLWIKNWSIQIGTFSLKASSQPASGDFIALNVPIRLIPNDVETLRNFELNYDVIVHQVLTHEILIAIRNDWEAGIYQEHPLQLGVISLDIPTNTIKPFWVNCERGSAWKGWVSIFDLGMSHIKEGTDHLLFLLVLLLPSPLLAEHRRWTNFIGFKKSIGKLLKIITAFTVGHSITLLFGTVGWLHFSSQWIEVLIACSILISAIHALIPLFFNKEIFIASGFGLIHGLAFSDTLSPMSLSPMQMALSIIGFNLGIEVMQLLIILFMLPSLLIIAHYSIATYQYCRIIAAILASIAAFAWLLERVTSQPNALTPYLEKIDDYGVWIIADLALLALLTMLNHFKQSRNKLA
jgi:hypothetical protein